MLSVRYIKKISFALYLLILVFGVSNISWGISLSELQQKGISNRKVVERYRLAVQKEEENLRVSRSPFWPSLDVSYNANSLDEDSQTAPGELSPVVITLATLSIPVIFASSLVISFNTGLSRTTKYF